jgi:hypothetical protein
MARPSLAERSIVECAVETLRGNRGLSDDRMSAWSVELAVEERQNSRVEQT